MKSHMYPQMSTFKNIEEIILLNSVACTTTNRLCHILGWPQCSLMEERLVVQTGFWDIVGYRVDVTGSVQYVCGKPRGFVFIYIATTDGRDHCAWVRRLEIQQAQPDSVFTLSGQTRQGISVYDINRSLTNWIQNFCLGQSV